MSSVNTHVTFNYSQPDQYHFSHDSVFLARKAYEHCETEDIQNWHGLDLCAGCGVIGLDFLVHFQRERNLTMRSFDFLEVQDVYKTHFQKNSMQFSADFKTDCALRYLPMNYQRLLEPEFVNKYQLILCNPPYFRKDQGALSPSDFKNRCRFFLDSDFKTLILGVASALAVGGKCFILLRDLQDHGFSPLEEAKSILQNSQFGDFKMTELEPIRGTGFVKIEKI